MIALSLFTVALQSLGAQPSAPASVESRLFFARRLEGQGGWSILSLDPSGEDERVEVPFRSGQGEYNPTLSPDGRTLLFNTYRYGGWKLATTKLGSGEVVRWTPGGDYYTCAAFSPDGAQVAYEWSRRTGTEIVVRPFASVEAVSWTAAWKQGDERSPSWAPDGTRLVFASGRTGLQQLYLQEGAQGEATCLSDGSGNDFAPAVSPDGKYVAFHSDRDGHADLFLLTLEGRALRPLSVALRGDDTRYTFSARDAWPLRAAWSPDGTEIAFLAARGEQYDLFVAPLVGEPRQVTRTPASELTPAWGRVLRD